MMISSQRSSFQVQASGATPYEMRNPMPREDRIVFHEETHTYRVDGIKAPRSVTGLVHEYQSGSFDPAVAVETMKRGKNWPIRRDEFVTDCGRDMTNEEICALWMHSGKVASARGTLLHYQAEAYLNGMVVEEPHSPDFQRFLLISNALWEIGWKPFRTEVCLVHIGLCVCGQLDALFCNDAGELCLLDWKRSKCVIFENRFRALKEPLNLMDDCNGFLYALQLNTYRRPWEQYNTLSECCVMCCVGIFWKANMATRLEPISSLE